MPTLTSWEKETRRKAGAVCEGPRAKLAQGRGSCLRPTPVEGPSLCDLLRGVPKNHWGWGVWVWGLTGLGREEVTGARGAAGAGAGTPGH